MACSFGEYLPTTLVRRLISPLSRSGSGWSECSFAQWVRREVHVSQDRRPPPASMKAASFGRPAFIWLTTLRHWILAAVLSSCAKMVPMNAAASRQPLRPA